MLMNTHEARVDALRKELARQNLDGFVIPISDEHMSEYVGAYAQRLEWLTGFGGSAGSAVVLKDEAAIFVDGRYTLQVREQVDGRLFAYESVPQTSVAAWLGEHAPEGARIGYDAWLHSKGWAESAARALAARNATLVAVERNPIDAIWQDRPQPSLAPAVPHASEVAGRSATDKRAEVAEWLATKGHDAAVISALDSVAWLLNIRGEDVSRTPVALSFVLAHADGTADLFIAPEKVTPDLVAHLGNAVRVQPREAFVPMLQGLAGKTVAVDPERAVAAIWKALEDAGAKTVAVTDPTVLPKAIKNPVEQAGHRAAQARDGAAISRFLHWLSVAAPKGGETELSAAAALQAEREKTGQLRDLSFDTISAAGPNGASPHYKVDEHTNRPIEPNSVYLVDSGGQYLDGTTDITRTVWIGPDAPPAEVKDRFTRVLKGHIALARAVFPRGTNGSQLDTLARQFLWSAGLDYAHGTGHGVGSFLAVHEGPQRIAKASGGQAGTGQELLPGMILSNEPGYYKAGEYGIRIENLILVEDRRIEGADGAYMGFETLTFAPIDRTLVDLSLLTGEERGWWNDYHAQVRALLAPQLAGDDLAWLETACAPL
ncbi:aminopeptidase P family protein [Novosphingobium cyanobacteriorum]|uniref:Aminopeptidase P family protein n=1 Tax=Novosphingobium cyanobacteriorum TaxID=3024215 RepID=A0ABT6CLE8_9SPHN|nr:aminopeptidase P family protein [Novosphingobium cyanobacteriorum]MDF8333167.1 aminopeptidase P family protein [Novosphingobium cyanobacteriorum]